MDIDVLDMMEIITQVEEALDIEVPQEDIEKFMDMTIAAVFSDLVDYFRSAKTS